MTHSAADASAKFKYFLPRDREGYTPEPTDPSERLFVICSIAEDDEREDALVEVNAGADINWRDPETNQTCIYRAAAEGKLEVVELMLDLGADVMPKEPSALPLGHLAAFHGKSWIFKLFHERNIDLSSFVNGMAPLHRACPGRQKRYLHLVQYMLENEIYDVNLKTEEGKTCMDLARSEAMRELLVKYGVEEVPTTVAEEL